MDLSQKLAHAESLFDRNDYIKSYAIFKSLSELQSVKPRVLRRLARIALILSKNQEASLYLDQLELYFPSDTWLPFFRAKLAESELDIDLASRYYKEALSLMPRESSVEQAFTTFHEQIPCLKARIAENDFDFETAFTYYSNAVLAYPDNTFISREFSRFKERWKDALESVASSELIFWNKSNFDASHKKKSERVLIVCWDICHNAVGRGITIAETLSEDKDVLIAGPLFPVFGETLWPPLSNGNLSIPICGWKAPSFAKFFEGCLRLAQHWPADVVWASKSRFHSIFIALIYRLVHGSKIICDIDDDELAMVAADHIFDFAEFESLFQSVDWNKPNSAIWTQLAQLLLKEFDFLTACNSFLTKKHNAILIPHGRSKSLAKNAILVRDSTRKSYGLLCTDHVVLFCGTIRRHKGLLEIAYALSEINDPNTILVIVGTFGLPDISEELFLIKNLRIKYLGVQPFSDVLAINAIADEVILFQDISSSISLSQTPAKLTDALAVGTRVFISDLPSTRDFIEAGVAIALPGNANSSLTSFLREQFQLDFDGSNCVKYFEQNLSYDSIKPFFYRSLGLSSNKSDCNSLSSIVKSTFKFIFEQMPGSIDPGLISSLPTHVIPFTSFGNTITVSKPINIVFFWKQNDTGLYGRRQDMFLRELSLCSNVGKILHVEPPINIDKLQFDFNPLNSSSIRYDHSDFLFASAFARNSGLLDYGKLHYRSYLYSESGLPLFGLTLPPEECFSNAVVKWIEELDITDNCIAWVCPIVKDFEKIYNKVPFPFVVSDFIDDQTKFSNLPYMKYQINLGYEFMYKISDLSLCNCMPIYDKLSSVGLLPILMPNGMDFRSISPAATSEKLLHARPIIGYCGNMNDRFDFDLVKFIALSRPEYDFTFIGSLRSIENRSTLSELPNVSYLGVKKYDEARQIMSSFDVAILPHLLDDLSASMNPLKLYAYRSLGIPVVSTNIQNILSEMSYGIFVASSYDDFIQLLDEVLASDLSFELHERHFDLSWESKFSTIWKQVLIDIKRKFP